MSDESPPQSESAASQTAAPQTDKKPRSPVERVLVWGGIIVLLLLVGVQAHARFGYELTLKGLQPLISDDLEGSEPLALADVDGHVVGFPSRTDNTISPSRSERAYQWRGLGGTYGITLAYNPRVDPPVITELVTDNAPVPEAVEPPEVIEEVATSGAPPSGTTPPGPQLADEGEGEQDGDGDNRPQRPTSEDSDAGDESTDAAPAEGSDEAATPDTAATPEESATPPSEEEAADTP